MKIVIVGATGTLGSAITTLLSERHDIISVARSSGDHQVDITDEAQIVELFNAIGPFDALISAMGKTAFGLLEDLTTEEWQFGLNNKLMGQVNLVRHGLKHINDNGSFTLTSGVLNYDPVKFGASAAMVDGAIEGFARSASIEMPRGVRINVVSPALVQESVEKYGDYFLGFSAVPAATAAKAYEKSVESSQTGQIYRVGWEW